MAENLKEKRQVSEEEQKKKVGKVLMLCTGGTIGMLHRVKDDPTTPLEPAKWSEIEEYMSAMKSLPFYVKADDSLELIDSSNMHPEYWLSLAAKVQEEYENYDGFVILHGTDTMAYTATALSFFFENLSKPVIITGSQLPLAKPRSDAAQNMVTALTIAAAYKVPVIPEVCVLFDKKLLRGNRSRKVSSSGFDGFDSPNFPPIAEIGEHIKVNTHLLRKIPEETFFINPVINKNVMLFDIFPGISGKVLRGVFDVSINEKDDKDKLRGLVLRTYGTGNAPTGDEFISEIIYAINDRKLVLVNITQCNQGMVEMGLYAASTGLIRAGVLSGVDMTPEAALVKMMFLLGQGYKDETFKEQMQRNLRGEQSYNAYNFVYEDKKDYDTEKDSIVRFTEMTIPSGFVREKIVSAKLRFDGVNFNKIDNEKPLDLAMFMNYPAASAETKTNIPQCIGVIENINESTELVLSCDQKVAQVINPALPLKLTAVSKNGNVSWKSMVLSIYTDV
ncbi:MAG: type I asparaginase [Treponema sp.]|nr:type I asparaginase [Treponema sp.]